ncbi:hypothetical protein [Lysobacter enzymogenes]|uniref:hypothetical protein n=1 Tax=Lysobacter enzymogenes TaxID=69 RepID=UPI00089AC777|nr:hypothetical protein [Lysobacter enzymogenes]SDX52074.1 hypothetical protein SAMN05421681_1064 [Lysobacter enzymogenes]
MPSRKPEPMLDYIRRRLTELKGQWPEISRRAEVPYFTLSKLHSGAVKNPRVETCQALHDALRAMEKQPPKGEAA